MLDETQLQKFLAGMDRINPIALSQKVNDLAFFVGQMKDQLSVPAKWMIMDAMKKIYLILDIDGRNNVLCIFSNIAPYEAWHILDYLLRKEDDGTLRSEIRTIMDRIVS
jgi:hypothetical protein